MSDELDYNEDLKIECDALDVEWLRQPNLYMKYAEISAEAEADVRDAKKELAATEAKIDLEVRTYSDKKPTEGFIKASIQSDKRYLEKLDELNDSLYHATICKEALKAMDQRKHALENEVRLWAGSYFAGPKEPRDIREQVDMKESGREKKKDEIRKKMKDKINN